MAEQEKYRDGIFQFRRPRPHKFYDASSIYWYNYPQTIHVAAVQAAGFNDDYGMLNNDLVIYGFSELTPTAFNQ